MFCREVTSAVLAMFLVVGIFLCGEVKVSAEKDSAPAVTYTAPISLYWLAKAEVPEAVEYAKYIDAGKVIQSEKFTQFERVEKINKIFQEIKYKSLNNFIVSGGYKNVIDLGCGVSPRCIKMAEQKINYVGVELESVVKLLRVYAPSFLPGDSRQYVNFVTADVTDRKAMLNAARNLDGEVCIIEDGLAIYLSREQQKAMLENIREILQAHGGCFVTSDFVAGDVFMSSNVAIYGEAGAVVVAQETQKLHEDVAEVLFDETMFDTDEDAIKFIESCGLKVERLPLFAEEPFIKSIRDLNDSNIANIQQMMTQEKFLWVMTAK